MYPADVLTQNLTMSYATVVNVMSNVIRLISELKNADFLLHPLVCLPFTSEDVYSV